MIGIPVVLSSRITFAPQIGAIGTPDEPGNLYAPTDCGMLLEAIQIWIKGTALTAPNWHEWELTLGRSKLTNLSQPIALAVRSEEAIQVGANQGSTPADSQAYLWTLPRPLYVPCNSTLQVKVKSGVADGSAVVTFIARVLPKGYPVPRTADVPYATSFRPGMISVGATETDTDKYIYSSGPNDLNNPFNFPLNVQRFTMGVTGTFGISPVYSVDQYLKFQQDVSMRIFPKITLADQRGSPIVREPIGLAQFVSIIRTNTDARFVLDPKEAVYCIADQTHKIGATSGGQIVQVGLGLVGWRQVPVSEVQS